jgi:hypothetical protein
MKNASIFLAKQLVLKGYVLKNDQDSIRFALEFVFSNLITASFIFMFGILLNRLMEALIFLITFVYFRILKDRFHASTYLACLILTSGFYLACLYVNEIINESLFEHFINYGIILNISIFLFEYLRGKVIFAYSESIYFISIISFHLFILIISFLFKLTDYSVFLVCIGLILVLTNAMETKEK